MDHWIFLAEDRDNFFLAVWSRIWLVDTQLKLDQSDSHSYSAATFFYIFMYKMTFLLILPNFNPLQTLEVQFFGLLFRRIYGRHYLTLF